jgi:hypothetical protein
MNHGLSSGQDRSLGNDVPPTTRHRSMLAGSSSTFDHPFDTPRKARP